MTEIVDTTDRRPWLLPAILLGVVYCAATLHRAFSAISRADLRLYAIALSPFPSLRHCRRLSSG